MYFQVKTYNISHRSHTPYPPPHPIPNLTHRLGQLHIPQPQPNPGHRALDPIYTGLVTTVQVLYLLEICCLG